MFQHTLQVSKKCGVIVDMKIGGNTLKPLFNFIYLGSLGSKELEAHTAKWQQIVRDL